MSTIEQELLKAAVATLEALVAADTDDKRQEVAGAARDLLAVVRLTADGQGHNGRPRFYHFSARASGTGGGLHLMDGVVGMNIDPADQGWYDALRQEIARKNDLPSADMLSLTSLTPLF